MPDDRESLGRLVRETWVAWAKKQPDPKPSWLTGWDDLDDGQREVDMLIGHAVAVYALTENALTYGLACPRCAGFLDRANDERERAERAEAKLAAIAAHCRGKCSYAVTRSTSEAIVPVADILAIIGSEEESRGD